MGNHLDRLPHVDYSELPTGDPSGMEQDELRVGVAYFFSEEEEEEQEGVLGLWGEPSPPPDELECSAFCRQECIFSKLGQQDLRPVPVSALLPRCRAGDLLELLGPAGGGAAGAGAGAGHWAVYVGDSQVIHLHRQEIRRERLQEVSGGRLARIVSTWYRYRPLPAELVLHNARGHVGLQGRDICWANSESFAAWCRFGKREFKAGGEVANTDERRYFLKLHLSASRVHTLAFPSLEDLIREKRRRDAGGRLGVLKELAILNQE